MAREGFIISLHPIPAATARERESKRGCHALAGAHTFFGSSRVMPHTSSISTAGLQVSHPKVWAAPGTHTLLSVMDMESSVRASLEISLSLALVAGAKT